MRSAPIAYPFSNLFAATPCQKHCSLLQPMTVCQSKPKSKIRECNVLAATTWYVSNQNQTMLRLVQFRFSLTRTMSTNYALALRSPLNNAIYSPTFTVVMITISSPARCTAALQSWDPGMILPRGRHRFSTSPSLVGLCLCQWTCTEVHGRVCPQSLGGETVLPVGK